MIDVVRSRYLYGLEFEVAKSDRKEGEQVSFESGGKST